jgi:benzoylformate decarboxylase
MTGKRALAEMLIAEGVEYVFGNPGTSETPFMDALQDYPQLRYMVALQEATAVGMADGYARATGKPAFANLHIAGGLANGISLLYNAYRGGTPLVLTAGNSDTRMLLTDPVLSGDLVEMTRQYTKWSAEINHPSDIPMVVRRAFKEAKTPPTGPVFVAFPWNTLDDEADVEIVPSSPGYFRIRPDADAVARASALLSGAESPIMVVGDRVAQSGAAREAVEVAELTGARVYAASYTEMNFPTSHPQFMGALNLSNPATRDRLAGADVLLAVGTSVFSSFLYVPDPFLSNNTKLVHLDSSPWEVEKIYPTEVGMMADPKAALADMADALQQDMSGSSREAARTRAAAIGDDTRRRREAVQARVRQRWDTSPMSVERMMTELAQALPSNAIIANEAITSGGALMDAMDFDEPGSIYGIRGGALGWGMPGSVGIQIAQPDRPVVAVVGDGASLYTIQALWTAARYGVPVTWVICNNRTYRILKVNMDIYLRDMLKDSERQSDYVGMNFDLPLNVAGIAEGFGITGRRVEDPAQLRPAIEEAIASGKPAVVDVTIDGSL